MTQTPSSTADLCDTDSRWEVVPLRLKSFGGEHRIDGIVQTVRVGDSNWLVKEMLGHPGLDRILVVDGSLQVSPAALVGDQMAQRAIDNGWRGLVVNGYVRDTVAIGQLKLGIWALGTWPKRGGMNGPGEEGVKLRLGSLIMEPGDRLVCDEDGVITLKQSAGGASE